MTRSFRRKLLNTEVKNRLGRKINAPIRVTSLGGFEKYGANKFKKRGLVMASSEFLAKFLKHKLQKEKFSTKMCTTNRKIPVLHIDFCKSLKNTMKHVVMKKPEKRADYQTIASPPIFRCHNVKDISNLVENVSYQEVDTNSVQGRDRSQNKGNLKYRTLKILKTDENKILSSKRVKFKKRQKSKTPSKAKPSRPSWPKFQTESQAKLFRTLQDEDILEEKRKLLWSKIRAKTSYKFSRRSLSVIDSSKIEHTSKVDDSAQQFSTFRCKVLAPTDQPSIHQKNNSREEDGFLMEQDSHLNANLAQNKDIFNKLPARIVKSRSSTKLVQSFKEIPARNMTKRMKKSTKQGSLMDPCLELDSVISNCENFLNFY